MSPLTNCSRARWFSAFLDQRTGRSRLRFKRGVRGFHGLAPCAPAGVAQPLLDFGAGTDDVRLKMAPGEQIPALEGVLAPIQADALR